MLRRTLDSRIMSLTPRSQQDLRADAVVAQIGTRRRRARCLAPVVGKIVAKRNRGRCRIAEPGADTVGQAGRARFADQHDHAPPRLADHAHRRMQHLAAPGRAVAEDVVEDVERVHAHQHRLRPGDVAFDQRDVLGIGDLVDIDVHPERAAEAAVEQCLDAALDDAVMPAPIADQVGDRADLQSVELRELHEVRQPRHGAVVVHDLADHAGRKQPRHAARCRPPPRYGRRARARRRRAPPAGTHARA